MTEGEIFGLPERQDGRRRLHSTTVLGRGQQTTRLGSTF